MEELNYGKNYLCGEAFEDYSHPFGAFVESTGYNENYAYQNAATCPDCGGGMVKMGSCFSCQSCGFGGCGL